MLPSQNKKRKAWWVYLATYKKPKKKKDDMKYLLMLLYMLTKDSPSKKSKIKRAAHYAQKSHSKPAASRTRYLQQCYIRMSYGNSKASSITFLKRYMQQLDKDDVKDKPTLFSDVPVTDEVLKDAVDHADERFYRFIISPEKNGIDLELLTKAVVKRLQRQMGREFVWFGAIHKNTNHHHVHLWINGTDKDGRKIDKIPRALATLDVRRFTQEYITAVLGYRTKAEVEIQKTGLYRAERFTKLDRELQNKQVVLPALHNGRWRYAVRATTEVDKKRLETLTNTGLAARHESIADSWYLERGWVERRLCCRGQKKIEKYRTR